MRHGQARTCNATLFLVGAQKSKLRFHLSHPPHNRHSYDYEHALSEILPAVASQKLAKGGFMVLRPDSGDTVQAVVSGLRAAEKVFGCDVNSKGFKVPRGCSVIQGAHTQKCHFSSFGTLDADARAQVTESTVMPSHASSRLSMLPGLAPSPSASAWAADCCKRHASARGCAAHTAGALNGCAAGKP